MIGTCPLTTTFVASSEADDRVNAHGYSSVEKKNLLLDIHPSMSVLVQVLDMA